MTLKDLQNQINNDIETVVKQEETYKKETKNIFIFFKSIRKGA